MQTAALDCLFTRSMLMLCWSVHLELQLPLQAQAVCHHADPAATFWHASTVLLTSLLAVSRHILMLRRM